MDESSTNKHTGTKMTGVEEERGRNMEPLVFLCNQGKDTSYMIWKKKALAGKEARTVGCCKCIPNILRVSIINNAAMCNPRLYSSSKSLPTLQTGDERVTSSLLRAEGFARFPGGCISILEKISVWLTTRRIEEKRIPKRGRGGIRRLLLQTSSLHRELIEWCWSVGMFLSQDILTSRHNLFFFFFP